MFLLSFYILKKILKPAVIAFLLCWGFSLVANRTIPQDIMVLLDSTDVELSDSLTYFDGLKDAYLVSAQKVVYEKELLRSRFLITLKKVVSGLHTALLPDYYVVAHAIVAHALACWPQGLEKVQLFKWFELISTKIKADGLSKKGKLKEILEQRPEDTLVQQEVVAVVKEKTSFDIVALPDEKKADAPLPAKIGVKRVKKAKCTYGKAKKARIINQKIGKVSNPKKEDEVQVMSNDSLAIAGEQVMPVVEEALVQAPVISTPVIPKKRATYSARKKKSEAVIVQNSGEQSKAQLAEVQARVPVVVVP